MDIYPEKVMQHIRNPKFKGEMENATIIADNGNPSCGDELTYYIKIEQGKIVDIKHDARGCAVSRAAADLLAEMVVGKTVEEARQLGGDDIVEALGGISPGRRPCATLSVDVLHQALEQAEDQGKQPA